MQMRSSLGPRFYSRNNWNLCNSIFELRRRRRRWRKSGQKGRARGKQEVLNIHDPAGTADWLARDSFCDGYQTESSPLSEPKGYTWRFDGPANESRELETARRNVIIFVSESAGCAPRHVCFLEKEDSSNKLIDSRRDWGEGVGA
jgi:hypothetical protein